jgi:hypothetical protein
MFFELFTENPKLPGNDEFLGFIEKHFAKSNPSDFLLVNCERKNGDV